MATKTTPTLSSAIATQSIEMLRSVVASALEIYSSKLGAEPKIETANGEMPISAVFDETTKWAAVAAQYAEIVSAVERMPKSADKSVEIAKLISTNQVLRHLTETKTSAGGLL